MFNFSRNIPHSKKSSLCGGVNRNNIDTQIKRLYASSIVEQLSLSGAWVAILASRGFSLVQIGFAETIFHIVSLLFEIPSGVLADVFGRKKMLLASTIASIVADIIMVFSNNFTLVCISIAFQALKYNFASGSGDALAYDSLKSVGEESRFEKYASSQLVIYRVCSAISTLTAGLALVLGYKTAYIASAVSSSVSLLILAGLQEIRIGESPEEKKSVWRQLLETFKKSLLFLKEARKAMGLMFANSAVGALDILLLFFLQAKLPEAGIPNWALGIALFSMQMGGVVGAKVILKIPRAKYGLIFALSLLTIATGIALEHTGLFVLMTAGGFISSLADDALQVRTNAILQDMFPSEQRATLISIESFTFSVIMIVLSPLAGIFFSFW